jgi:hypothetical protein
MRLTLVLAMVLALTLAALPAGAQERATVTIEPSEARVGERVTLTIDLEAPADTSVELDVAASDLGLAEVAESEHEQTGTGDGQTRHQLRLRLTAFEPGPVVVRPALRLTHADGDVETLVAPAAGWQIVSVLPPGELPEDIRDLQPQMTVGGQGFAYASQLRFAALVVATVVAALALLLLTRRYLRRPRQEAPPETVPSDVLARGALDELTSVQPTRDSLPSIYSRMGTVIRRYLGSVYQFPASSLTSRELEAQMVDRGVHRWQARMASSLLAECDAVAYAGYRPAPGRLQADLDMAYQIVGFDPAESEQAQIISFRRPGISE